MFSHNIKFKVLFGFVVKPVKTESGGATIDARGRCCATFEERRVTSFSWSGRGTHIMVQQSLNYKPKSRRRANAINLDEQNKCPSITYARTTNVTHRQVQDSALFTCASTTLTCHLKDPPAFSCLIWFGRSLIPLVGEGIVLQFP